MGLDNPILSLLGIYDLKAGHLNAKTPLAWIPYLRNLIHLPFYVS